MDHWHEKENWLNKPLDFETIQSFGMDKGFAKCHGSGTQQMSTFFLKGALIAEKLFLQTELEQNSEQ